MRLPWSFQLEIKENLTWKVYEEFQKYVAKL